MGLCPLSDYKAKMNEKLTEQLWDCNLCFDKKRTKEFYGGDFNKGIALVFQNPGPISEKLKKKYGKAQITNIDKWREEFHNYWIENKQNDFFRRFFELLNNKKLIETNNLERYIKNREYFHDLYITDSMKCCGTTNDIDNLEKEQRKKLGFNEIPCYTKFLSKEIKAIISNNLKNKLIIAFGSRTINFFKRYNPINITDNEPFIAKAAKYHGYLYKCDSFYLISSIHIAKSYMCPRDTHFELLKEGIEKYCEIIKK